MYEMSRDDFEKRGQSLGEEEVMPRVITLLHGLDQIPPDLVVKFQPIDIVDVIL
jgi:hypothetical protein